MSLYKPQTNDELKRLCSNHGIHLGDIDVSLIEDFSSVFENSLRKGSEWEGIEKWDTSRARTLNSTFQNAVFFDADIGGWDVSCVEDMDFCFCGAEIFSQDIGKWDTFSLKSINYTFARMKRFNIPLEWEVENVESANFAFFENLSFNQNLENWNPKNLKSAVGIFSCAVAFNSSINGWNLEQCVDFSEAFLCAISYNQPMDKVRFEKLEKLNRTFANARSFNQPLLWNTPKLIEAVGCFSEAHSFNGDLHTWYFGNCCGLDGFLYHAYAYSKNIADFHIPSSCSIEDFMTDTITQKMFFKQVEESKRQEEGNQPTNVPIAPQREKVSFFGHITRIRKKVLEFLNVKKDSG